MPVPVGFTSIQDHIAETEALPDGRARMARARARLAELLHADAPETIRSLRLRKGLSQYDLGTAVGTSQPQIARIEAGRHNPTFDTFERIAKALGTSVGGVVEAFANARKGISQDSVPTS